MDFLSQLLSAKGGGKAAASSPSNPHEESAAALSRPPSSARPGQGGGAEDDVDESTPPTVEYAFSADAEGQRLQALWAPFEEAYSDMAQSIEAKMEALGPFAQAFVAAYDDSLPQPWKSRGSGQQQQEHPPPSSPRQEEGDESPPGTHETSDRVIVPPTLQAAKGHPKLLAVLVGTFLIDTLASSRQQAAKAPLSPRDCREYEREILRHEVHDFLFCHRTLLELTHPPPPSSESEEEDEWRRRRRRREDLVRLLQVVGQVAKFKHNRRLLLHSLGHGFVHFLVSLLLALCRVLEATWRVRGGDERGGDSQPTHQYDDAIVWLLVCLLSTLQIVGHGVPVFAEYCRVVEGRRERRRRRGRIPMHPWSAERVAGLCVRGYSAIDKKEEEEGEEDDGVVEAALRSAAFEETWSLVAVQEGALPALLHVLHLSVTMLSSLASSSSSPSSSSSSSSFSDLPSHPVLSAPPHTVDLGPLLLVLQNEALLCLGAFVALHPHDALPMLGKGQMEKDIFTSVLTAFVGLEGRGEEEEEKVGLALAWQRAELTLAFLQECVPVVTTATHVQGLLDNPSAAQGRKEKRGGGRGGRLFAGFSGASSSSSSSPGRLDKTGASTSSTSSSSSSLAGGSSTLALTGHDLATILSEGLVRCLKCIESLPLPPTTRRREEEEEKVEVQCLSSVDLPVPYQHYDLWPWVTEEEEEDNRREKEDAATPNGGVSIHRQHSNRRMQVLRSLSSSAAALPEVFDLARPFLRDASISYRLVPAGPLLCEEEEEEEEEGGGLSRDAMYASAFAHLLALCRLVPEVSTTPRLGKGGGGRSSRKESPPCSPWPCKSSSKHSKSPLETIAACRHLKLWGLLLHSVGLAADEAASSIDLRIEPGGGGGEEGRRNQHHYILHSGSKQDWFHAQDLCLELLHRVFVAAQRPPTTNFISSPTLEMGLVVALLDKQATQRDPEKDDFLLTFQACRWLDMLIREHEASPSHNASAPAFNEHGVRLLTLLPGLLAASYTQAEGEETGMPLDPSSSSSSSSSPLRWPAQHALLSLMASTIHVASVMESKMTLEPWVNEVLLDTSKERGGGRGGFAIFFQLLLAPSNARCHAVLVFIITRFLHILGQMSVGATVVVVSPASTGQFYRQCVGLLHASSSTTQGALLALLRGLAALLRERQFPSPVLRYHQRALRHAGIFPFLGDMLATRAITSSSLEKEEEVEEVDASGGPTLLCQGLALLTALVAENEVNKQAMVTTFLSPRALEEEEEEEAAGNTHDEKDELCSTLLFQLVLRGAALDRFETVRVLFDVLVTGAFSLQPDDDDTFASSSSSSTFVVKVPGMVRLLFLLLPHLTPTRRVDVFRLLRAMVAGGRMDKNADLAALLMDLLLSHLPTLSHDDGSQGAAIDLLAEVGTYHISVAQLRRVLDLLQCPSTHPLQPVYSSRLVAGLAKMAQQPVEGPAHYFLMDGPQAGLRLRPLVPWSKKHYTLLTWLRLDEKAASSASLPPHLFSLTADDGTAVESCLVPIGPPGQGEFALQMAYRRQKATPQYIQWQLVEEGVGGADDCVPRIVAGAWTFLAIAHRAPTGFRSGASDVLVVVNDVAYRGSLPYPSMKVLSNRSYVGASHEAGSRTGAFQGKMGVVLVLDEGLKEEQLRAVYAHGPDGTDAGGVSDASSPLLSARIMLLLHPGRFRNLAAGPVVVPSSSVLSPFFNQEEEERGESTVAFFNTTQDWHTRSVLDLLRAPAGDADEEQAKLCRGTYVCRGQGLHRALEALGGVKVLLPLLAQVDLPVVGGEPASPFSVALIMDLLGMLLGQSPAGTLSAALFLDHDEEEEEEDEDQDGYLFLAHLLERLPPPHLSSELVAAIQGLIARVATVWKDPLVTATLIAQLLGNFKIWRRAAFEVQEEVVALLLHHLQAASSVSLHLSQLLSVGYLLDVLQLFYAYASPASSSSHLPTYPSSSSVDDNEDEEGKTRVRRRILELLHTVLQSTGEELVVAEDDVCERRREEDMGIVFDFLAAVASSEEGQEAKATCEVLHLVLRLLSPELVHVMLSAQASPLYLLLQLVQPTHPLPVRLLAFSLLAKALGMAHQIFEEAKKNAANSSITTKRPISFGSLFSSPIPSRIARTSSSESTSSSISAAKQRIFGAGSSPFRPSSTSSVDGRLSSSSVQALSEEDASMLAPEVPFAWQEPRVAEFVVWMAQALHGVGEEARALAAKTLWRVFVLGEAGSSSPSSFVLPLESKEARERVKELPVWFGGLMGSHEASSTTTSDSSSTFDAVLPALLLLDTAEIYKPKLQEKALQAALPAMEKLQAKVGRADAVRLGVDALVRDREQQGHEHLAQALQRLEDERLWMWHHRWLLLLDEVANEQDPWGPCRERLSRLMTTSTEEGEEEGTRPVVSWAVGDVEDHLRHRRKLLRREVHQVIVPDLLGDEADFLRHTAASNKMRGGKDKLTEEALRAAEAAEEEAQQHKQGLGLSASIASLTLGSHEGVGGEDLEDMTQTSLWKELAKYQKTGPGEEEEEEEDEDEVEEGARPSPPLPELILPPDAESPSPPPPSVVELPVGPATMSQGPPAPLLIPSPSRQPQLSSHQQSSQLGTASSLDKEELVVITTPRTPMVYLNRGGGGGGGGAAGGRRGGERRRSSAALLMAGRGARSSVRLGPSFPHGSSSSSGTTTTTPRKRLLNMTDKLPGGGNVKDSRACEVIRPFVVSPGIFEVTKRCLCFLSHEPSTSSPSSTSAASAAAAAFPPPPPPPASDSTAWCLQPFPSTLWHLDDLHALYVRLYQQQTVALEFFFLDQSSLFVNFLSKPAALAVYKTIRKLKPRHLEIHLGHAPRQICQKMKTSQGHSLTQAWAQREISNLEYLAYLNLVAGRTWHDLSQYPIFPWVLADYASPELDLGRSETFRDLRWPMGAQRPEARQALASTYRMLEEEYRRQQAEVLHWDSEAMGGPPPAPMPPFHHGSHYSTAAFVLWYLLRVEPFASLHVHLQSGKFDHPDRQFRSLRSAYEGCVSNPSDVKELIPEFFYQPEFLANVNGLDLGVTQWGQALGDVELPPWARGQVDEFVRLHREALESEYVSEHLHHWIDLIFGYKQRPPFLSSSGASSSSSSSGARKGSGGAAGATAGAAVEACNVFFNLTYHEALDMEALQKHDPLLYESTLKQIQDFGQTPVQLFTTPHPSRTLLHNATEIIWPIASVVQGAGTSLPLEDASLSHSTSTSSASSSISASSASGAALAGTIVQKPERLLSFPPPRVAPGPVLAIVETANCDRLLTVDSAWHVGWHGWSVLSPDVLPPFKIKPDLSGLVAGMGGQSKDAPQEVLLDADLGLLFTCGYLDCSFKVATLEDPAASSSSFGLPSSSGGGEEGGGGSSDAHQRLPHQEIVQSIAQHRDTVRCLALGKNKDVQHHYHHTTMTTTASATVSASRGTGAAGGSGGGSGSGGGWLSSSRAYLVTGGEDCSVMVWNVLARSHREGGGGNEALSFGSSSLGGGVSPVCPEPVHVLRGHAEAVMAVAVDVELDVVISGGRDGRVLVHSLRDGRFVRALERGGEGGEKSFIPPLWTLRMAESDELDASTTRGCKKGIGVSWVGVSSAGYLLSYSQASGLLTSHSVNGRLRARLHATKALRAFCFSEDGHVVLVGGEDKKVTMLWCHNLRVANDGPRRGLEAIACTDGSCETQLVKPFSAPITSLALTAHERHLLVGLANGELRILAPDANYLRQRLKKKLETLGFY